MLMVKIVIVGLTAEGLDTLQYPHHLASKDIHEVNAKTLSYYTNRYIYTTIMILANLLIELGSLILGIGILIDSGIAPRVSVKWTIPVMFVCIVQW